MLSFVSIKVCEMIHAALRKMQAWNFFVSRMWSCLTWYKGIVWYISMRYILYLILTFGRLSIFLHL